VSILTAWLKQLISVLTNFDHPIDLADLKRIVGPSPDAPVGDPGDAFLFKAIFEVSRRVNEVGMKLVVEDGHCLSCNRTNSFSADFSYTCKYCNKESVTPPKFCINRKDSFY